MSAEGGRILIVDDSEDDLFLAGRLLEQVGFVGPSVTALSAAEAMEILESHPAAFDLAFLDICMPMVDGLELLAWIRARPLFAGLKVVMFTSSDDSGDIDRARATGADG